MIASLNHQQTTQCFSRLQARLKAFSCEVLYLNLGDVKIIKVVCCHPKAGVMIRRQMAWSLVEPVEHPDAVLYFWEEPKFDAFLHQTLGLNFERESDDDFFMLVQREDIQLTPFAESHMDTVFRAWYDNQYYYAVQSMDPENLNKEGHLFVHLLYRILNSPSTQLIHGACVGLDGKGVLLCARGGAGKSTLTVTSLFKGFEFVSDDYMVLRKEGDTLMASPLYSMIALSPQIYNLLYNDLGPTRFISLNGRMEKYLLDIAGWRGQARWNYPIKACIFPEIAPVEAPQIIRCTPQEKGRAITHMIHSTISQMNDQGNAATVRKLVCMLNGLDFYRIQLSPDIFLNTERLRQFVKQLN